MSIKNNVRKPSKLNIVMGIVFLVSIFAMSIIATIHLSEVGKEAVNTINEFCPEGRIGYTGGIINDKFHYCQGKKFICGQTECWYVNSDEVRERD